MLLSGKYYRQSVFIVPYFELDLSQSLVLQLPLSICSFFFKVLIIFLIVFNISLYFFYRSFIF